MANRQIAMLMGAQAFGKLINFGLNVAIVRSTGTRLFGASAVPFALLLSTIQFVSREGIRSACQRMPISRGGGSTKQQRAQLSNLVNLSWCVMPAAVVLGVAAVALMGRSEYEGVDDFERVLAGIGVAAVLELAAEPAYNLMCVCEKIHVRAATEAAALTAKCVTTWLCIVWLRLGAHAYVAAQLAYGLVLIVGLYGYVAASAMSVSRSDFPARSVWDLMPGAVVDDKKVGVARYVDALAFGEARAFTVQAAVKHVLTEGDKLVLMLASSATDHAVYGVVSNLGSLAARLVFEPVESQSRIQFAKLQPAAQAAVSAGADSEKEREFVAAYREGCQAFSVRLKAMVLLGLTVAVFGPPYSWLLLRLLYGDKYGQQSSAPTVLSWYCGYVLAMGVNGVTEAFRDCVATKEQLESRSPVGFTGVMVASCGACSLLAYVAVPRLGAAGIVLANTANLCLRICFSCHFIANRVRLPKVGASARDALVAAVPEPRTLLAFAVAFAMLVHSRQSVGTDPSVAVQAAHVAAGVLCLGAVAATVYVLEWSPRALA